ncbi:MAG: [protein-PII] uridylyltransferase [Rubripirellula sp.]|jgi:[protein-PII] uridylyltransferase
MSMRPIVLRCRAALEEGRRKALEQHRSGTPGMQVSTLLADLYDDVVLDIWHEAIREHATDERLTGLSLIAHGGFGRRDLAPFSDADLMLLTTPKAESLAIKIAGNLQKDIGDSGIDPGFSFRTANEACRMAWEDPVIYSSLSESRLLAGSLRLYSKYFYAFRHGAMRRSSEIVKKVVAARREERGKWGDTAYLLRPNVKRSRGALRDIQLIRWIGFARYGETDLERLVKLGALPEEDYRYLRKAYAFMLRLRHELHFREGKTLDVLDRGTQLEIAEEWGYEGSEGILPVEQFMQDYFDNTRNVRYAAAYFVDDAQSRPLIHRAVESVLSREVAEHIRMGPTHIWVPKDHLEQFASSLPDILRLMSLANQHCRRITHQTWQAIRQAMQDRVSRPPDAETIDAFLSLLSRPGRLAPLLRRLHELRVIEQLIPEFKHMRGLLQFNAYHKYTVDAHSFRAVEAATELQNAEGGMGRRYRRLADKRLLHLALLIHDIGKGYEEDHSIVGARIAKETAKRLNLDPVTAETLEWLVLKHLAVNVVAFRHDLSDPQIVLAFAAEVGSIRRLELLVVHSYADLVAVGPGVATDWKVNLIEDLYKRTRRYFDSGSLPGSPDDPEIELKRSEVREQLQQLNSYEQCFKLLDRMPLSLLSRADSDHLAKQIELVVRSLGDGALCTSSYDERFNATRYTVIRREDEHSIGTFARATGVLSTSGLTILRAQIEMVGDLAWDNYWVTDLEAPAEQQVEARHETICARVCHLLDSPGEPLPAHRRKWDSQNPREGESVNVLPTKVVFDNDTVERYTILSFFAYDEVGLLYRIAATLAKMNVVLHFAKIDTHLDQVADVFYVSEPDGSKLTNSERRAEIRNELLSICS